MGCPRVRLSFSMDRQTSWACASSSTELVHYAQTADAGVGGAIRTGSTNGEAMLRPVPVQRGAAADTHKRGACREMAVTELVADPSPASRRAPDPSPRGVSEWARQQGLQMVDLKFIDLPGQWQHFTVPISELKEGVFADGLGLAGSSIRGWQKINESDMLVIPDPATALVDPVCKVPTLSLLCDIRDPLTKQPYTR